MYMYFSKLLRLLWILVCFIVCDSSFFLLCSLLSFIVVHYARDCSCTCIYIYNVHAMDIPMYMYMYMYMYMHIEYTAVHC